MSRLAWKKTPQSSAKSKGVFEKQVCNEMMILYNEIVMRKLCNENVMINGVWIVWDVMKKIGCEIM